MFALLATATHAEKVVGKYIMAGAEMEVEAGINDKGELVVFFNVLGEYANDKVMMSVAGESNIYTFIKKLRYCKSKFTEWKQVARQNNVVDFSKMFEVTFPGVELWWRGYDDWYSSLEANCLKPFFWVSEEGETAFVASGIVEDWRNMFIEQKWYIFLCDESEFDSLINALNPSRFKSQLTPGAQYNHLFK